MRRRDVLRGAGLAAVATGLAACGPRTGGDGAGVARVHWKMVTSWPTNFPGLGTGAARLAASITAASGGRLTVRVHGAGELVPAFGVFDAVARGTAEMGHSAAYYWQALVPSAPLFCTVPFGLTATGMGAWLHEGGGLALWREAYAPHGLRPFPAGNTGMQMAGWFREPVESLASLQGLRIRMPGLGGEVMARVGASPVNLPGDAVFAALEAGTLDAAEWMGPYNDLAFGLHRAARYGYTPGWQEPGPALEATVNAAAWAALPLDLQAIVETCCRAPRARPGPCPTRGAARRARRRAAAAGRRRARAPARRAPARCARRTRRRPHRSPRGSRSRRSPAGPEAGRPMRRR